MLVNEKSSILLSVHNGNWPRWPQERPVLRVPSLGDPSPPLWYRELCMFIVD